MVFRYLLSVRRVQSQLQHCWAMQMQRKHLKFTKTDAVKWLLRNHMAFLIDNLQYYLQVQFKLLRPFSFAISETQQIRRKHNPITITVVIVLGTEPNL